MADNDAFFDEKKAAAILKHGVLRRYPAVFASKAGTLAGGRVTLVDGYAGRGTYEDGSDGSPRILQTVGDYASAMSGRDVEYLFVEAKDDYASALRSTVGERATVLRARFEDVVDDVMTRAAGRALLVFVDPFSTGIDFASMRDKILNRAGRVPVEVLLHFSLTTVRREGRAVLLADEGPRQARLDRFLGDRTWREVMAHDGDATENALAVAKRYERAVETQAQCASIAVDVREHPDHKPLYRLVLFTRSHHGLWFFADAAGKARVDWLESIDRRRYDEQQLALDRAGVLSLFEDPGPVDAATIEADVEATVVPVLVENLRLLLSAQERVHLGRSTREVYGTTLGIASEKHVRRAVRQLADSGAVMQPKTTNLVSLTLRRR